jgi:spore maturation protein CgeB
MLDDWVRWNSRHAVLTALLEGGISVTLVGDGAVYAQLAQRYPDQLHFLGSADISQVVSFMARSKVVMNPCMAYAEGLHERLFTAMLCKAVPFTPRTPYLEEKFGSCFWYIDLKDLGSMVRQVRHILEAPQEAALQVEQNYRWAMEQHTWEHRGEEIIDYYEQWIAPEKGQGELP